MWIDEQLFGLDHYRAVHNDKLHQMPRLVKQNRQSLPQIYAGKSLYGLVKDRYPSANLQDWSSGSMRPMVQQTTKLLPKRKKVRPNNTKLVLNPDTDIDIARREQEYSRERNEYLSRPKAGHCHKKYCLCYKMHDMAKKTPIIYQRKSREQKKSIDKQKYHIPQLKNNRNRQQIGQLQGQIFVGKYRLNSEPDDYQSKHKILQRESRNQSIQQLCSELRPMRRSSDQEKLHFRNNCEKLRKIEMEGYKQQYNPEQRKQVVGAKNKQKADLIVPELNEPKKIDEADIDKLQEQQKRDYGNLGKELEPAMISESTSLNVGSILAAKETSNPKARANSSINIIVPTQNSTDDFRRDNKSQNSLVNPCNLLPASPNASLLLSNQVLSNDKSASTLFNTLQQKSLGTSSNSHGKRRAHLFMVPQETEYSEYLLKYKPMDKQLKLKTLVSSSAFRIMRMEGGVYFGEMQQNKREGQGIFVSQRRIFEGTYENNEQVSGYERTSQGMYCGQYRKRLREGKGKWVWQNGEIFQGNWVHGLKEGFGVWRSPTGDSYEGQWKANCQSGKGVYKHRVSTYEGQFVEFLKHGAGVEQFRNGDRYEGTYINGKPDGDGLYQWADGAYYKGEFREGLREGKGIWKQSTGNEYVGQFHNDEKHGRGKETYVSGEYFQGQFSHWSKVKGLLHDCNGNTITIG